MGGFELIFGIVPIVVIVIVIMATSVRILRDYERAVIFRSADGRTPWSTRAAMVPDRGWCC
jgi:hypothetical protein